MSKVLTKNKEEMKNKKEKEKIVDDKQKKEEDKKKEEERKIKLQREKEDILSNNKILKKQLCDVTKKVEEIISTIKEKKLYGIPINNNDNIKKVDLKKYNEFLAEIEKQKKETESYKVILDYDNKFSQISKDENELKYMKKQKKELKKEYDYYDKINKKQNKELNFLSNENFDSLQSNELTEKLQQLKKNYKKLFVDYKDLSIKIKKQYNEINRLEEECHLMNDNIETIKKLKIKNEFKDIINDNGIDNDIKKIKEAINEKKIIVLNQEEYYKSELIVQKKKKNVIEDEIRLIELRLSKYYKKKKINELKMKELEKIKNEIKRSKLKEKKENNLLKLKQQKENIKIFNLNKYRKIMENIGENKFNFDLRNYALEEDKKNSRMVNRYNKPNLQFSKFNSKSCINIFAKSIREEKKIKREKEKEEFIKNIGIEIDEHEKQRGKMIQEIEYLKDDIEKMLNKNDIIDQNLNDMKKNKKINDNNNEIIQNNNNYENPENNNNDVENNNNIEIKQNNKNIKNNNDNYTDKENNDIYNYSSLVNNESKTTTNKTPFDFGFSNK